VLIVKSAKETNSKGSNPTALGIIVAELNSSAVREKMLKKFFLAVGSCVLFFLLLEGFFSSLLVVYEMWSPQQRRTMTGPSMQYHPELGWVSVPNYYDQNYFAPNIYLRTNSRGFRANEEFTERVPPGKLRIICSGGSFTFGEGVSNDRTWCQDLETIDDRFQTANMSESGYGVDQMYLRYKLDGSVLDIEQWPLPRIIRGERLRNLEVRIRRLNTEWNRVFSYGGAIVHQANGSFAATRFSLLQKFLRTLSRSCASRSAGSKPTLCSDAMASSLAPRNGDQG